MNTKHIMSLDELPNLSEEDKRAILAWHLFILKIETEYAYQNGMSTARGEIWAALGISPNDYLTKEDLNN